MQCTIIVQNFSIYETKACLASTKLHLFSKDNFTSEIQSLTSQIQSVRTKFPLHAEKANDKNHFDFKIEAQRG